MSRAWCSRRWSSGEILPCWFDTGWGVYAPRLALCSLTHPDAHSQHSDPLSLTPPLPHCRHPIPHEQATRHAKVFRTVEVVNPDIATFVEFDPEWRKLPLSKNGDGDGSGRDYVLAPRGQGSRGVGVMCGDGGGGDAGVCGCLDGDIGVGSDSVLLPGQPYS